MIIKDRVLVHQVKNVLKLHKGDFIAFFNDRPEDIGFDFKAEVKNIEKASAAFMIRDRIENNRENSKKLVLYQSLIKKDKFECVLQKATEVGVNEIVPMLSARSEKKSLNPTRCKLILKEAAEQSGRAIIPKLHDVITFEKAFEQAEASGYKTYFTSTAEKEYTIHPSGERAINLFVGPEGGWDDREFTMARARNCEVISLGRLTLRSETAAIVASYTLLWV